MNRLCACFCVALLIAAGCKTTRSVQKSNPPAPDAGTGMNKEKLLKRIEENRFTFHYLVIKGKAEADMGPQGNESFTYRISMNRDSALVLSVSKFGIEAFRMLARPDSVFARFSLEHRAVVSDFHYLADKTGLPLTFPMLQDLLVGNAVFLGDSIQYDGERAGHYHLKNSTGSTLIQYEIMADAFRTATLQGKDPARDFESRIHFSAYNPTGNRTMPWQGQMSVEKPQRFSLNFEHTKVEAPEEAPEFNFQIPPGYEIEYVNAKGR